MRGYLKERSGDAILDIDFLYSSYCGGGVWFYGYCGIHGGNCENPLFHLPDTVGNQRIGARISRTYAVISNRPMRNRHCG